MSYGITIARPAPKPTVCAISLFFIMQLRGGQSRAAVPPSLGHTLQQFRERGRLPFYEEETFSRDSWLAVLLGQSVIPVRIDPLTDAVAPAEAERAMEQMRGAIGTFVDRLPKYSDFLQRMSQKAA